MKQEIQGFIKKLYPGIDFDVFYPPEGFGDYSTNIAFLLAKEKNENPQRIAEGLAEKLRRKFKKEFEKIEVAKNGFINFYLSKDYLLKQLEEFSKGKLKFFKVRAKKINLEFVSANPVGPLTVGNARVASYGDTLGNIFNKAGFRTTKEYYVNDIGVQVRKLGESVFLRIKELKGEKIDFAPDLYQGEYIKEIAGKILEKNVLPEGDNEAIEFCKNYAMKEMIDSARESLKKLGVNFNVWFFESQLHKSDEVKKVLNFLKDKGYIYEKEGALWFKVSDFYANEKDAVVVKTDGSTSYLMNDIAYTKDKLEKRKFDKAINIWGTDHHGDVLRLKAGAKALGYADDKLEILLHQLVLIRQGGKLFRMSKRGGKFVLFDELLEIVNKDVARFFFLMKDLNTHMEFDVDLAKEQSAKNPVYYIQYAFARINSIFEKLKTKNEKIKIIAKDLWLIKEKEELDLIKWMVRFPEIIFEISQSYQVHHLPHYTLELANRFHKFYEKQRVISENKAMTKARLALVRAVLNVLGETLDLMEIEAPKRM